MYSPPIWEGDMSLVVSILTRDAVVVASDTRGLEKITGEERPVRKIFLAGDYIVGVVGYGDYSIQPIRAAMSGIEKRSLPEFAKYLGECALADHLARDGNVPSWWPWTRRRPFADLSKYGDQFIVAGYSPDVLLGTDSPQVFECSPSNRYVPVGLIMEPYSAMGVRDVARYLLRSLFYEGISVEDAEKLAVFAICETARINVTVAPPIHIAVADKDGARMVPSDKVATLVDESPRISWSIVYGASSN